MALSFSPSSSLNGKQRVLIVTVKSAELKTKKRGKTYAYAHVHSKGRLRTKMDNSTRCLNPTWGDKFMFSIDSSFLHQDTNVYFEIYRARKGFADSLIGIATCDVKSLFGCHGTEHKGKVEDNDCKPEFLVAYDTEEEEGDPRYPNMFKGEEDSREPDILKEEEEEEERRLKGSACLEIMKGSRNMGVMNVELEVGEIISCVGKYQWKNMAMPYEEFMGLTSHKKSNKEFSWICFFPENTQILYRV